MSTSGHNINIINVNSATPRNTAYRPEIELDFRKPSKSYQQRITSISLPELAKVGQDLHVKTVYRTLSVAEVEFDKSHPIRAH
jgi:hypothetical protein